MRRAAGGAQRPTAPALRSRPHPQLRWAQCAGWRAQPELQLSGRWVLSADERQLAQRSAAQPAQLPPSLQQCLKVAWQAAAHLLPARQPGTRSPLQRGRKNAQF